MTTIRDIREKHRIEIDDFIKLCKHENVGDWVDIYSAFHGEGGIKIGEGRLCTICEKAIKFKIGDYEVD